MESHCLLRQNRETRSYLAQTDTILWLRFTKKNYEIIQTWIERLSDLLQIRERGIPIIVGYMGIPLTKEMQ